MRRNALRIEVGANAIPHATSDAPHTTEELLDVVFALMSRVPAVLDDLVPPSKPWVLWIDDDYDFSKVLSHRLEKLGVGVINAYDGADGFQKAFMQPASAIVLDYNMPNGKVMRYCVASRKLT